MNQLAELSNKEIGILILFFVLLAIVLINRIWRRFHKDEVSLKDIVEAANGRDFNAEAEQAEENISDNDEDTAEEAESESEEENTEKKVKVEDINYEKEFLARAESGETSVLLTTIPSIQKCKILQSLLYSAGIPSYAQTEHVSGIFGNTSGLPDTIFSVKLNVLEKDLEAAKELMNSQPEN